MTGIKQHHILYFDKNNNLNFRKGTRTVTAYTKELDQGFIDKYKDYATRGAVSGGESPLNLDVNDNMLITISLDDSLLNWYFWNNEEDSESIYNEKPIRIKGDTGEFEDLVANNRIMTVHYKGTDIADKKEYKFDIFIENRFYKNGRQLITKLIVDPVIKDDG